MLRFLPALVPLCAFFWSELSAVPIDDVDPSTVVIRPAEEPAPVPDTAKPEEGAPAQPLTVVGPVKMPFVGVIKVTAANVRGGPSANHYPVVRLNQGKEAPRAVTWGQFNRHALIRLPIQARTEEGRVVTEPTVEFRLPDGSAHPYLVLAGIAQAFLLGRETENLEALLAATEVTNSEIPHGVAVQVPRNFEEVARELEEYSASLAAGDVFPPGMLENTRELLLEERRQN